jgi:hypothetical protein
MLHPEQQPLPNALCRALTLAVESWERGDADTARTQLHSAAEAGREGGYI